MTRIRRRFRLQFATRSLFLLITVCAVLSLVARRLLSLPAGTARGILLASGVGTTLGIVIYFVTSYLTEWKLTSNAVLFMMVVIFAVRLADHFVAYLVGLFSGVFLAFQAGAIVNAFAQAGRIETPPESKNQAR